MDYDNNKFSISQAQFTQGAPSHIVTTSAASGTNTTENNTTDSDNPNVVKTTSHTSHGIGTGAIAGIAVAIVVLAAAAAGFCLWRFKFRKSRRDGAIHGTAELEGDVEPKGVHEAFNKRRLSHESAHETKKGASVDANEVPRTPPVELEGAGPFGGSPHAEPSIGQGVRAELPSPDPFMPQLESPGFGIIRSELSTPEPPSELSTADPSLVPELTSRELAHEMSSNRNSRHRPGSYFNNSLDSDTILPQDSASVRPRLHRRKGSEDTLPTPTSSPPKRPSLRYSGRRHSGQQRPHHGRLQSSSSHDTFETRFMKPPQLNRTPSHLLHLPHRR